MRVCTDCKKSFAVSDFYFSDGRYSSYCKVCHGIRNRRLLRTRYYTNLSESRRKAREWAFERNKPKIEFLRGIKSDNPCTDCGRFFDPVCMDFDHNPGRKRWSIAELTHSAAKLTLLKSEIKRCELVCACCHRLRTSRRKQYRKPI